MKIKSMAILCIFLFSETPVAMELSSLAMIGGYLVRIVEENTCCLSCLEQLSSMVSDSPLMCLIKMQDRGALRYPSRKFVFFLRNVLNFSCKALKFLGKVNLLKKLKVFVVPKFTETFKCVDCNQGKLSDIVVTKFLKPVLDNHARKVNNDNSMVKTIRTKPLSRKVLKL